MGATGMRSLISRVIVLSRHGSIPSDLIGLDYKADRRPMDGPIVSIMTTVALTLISYGSTNGAWL